MRTIIATSGSATSAIVYESCAYWPGIQGVSCDEPRSPGGLSPPVGVYYTAQLVGEHCCTSLKRLVGVVHCEQLCRLVQPLRRLDWSEYHRTGTRRFLAGALNAAQDARTGKVQLDDDLAFPQKGDMLRLRNVGHTTAQNPAIFLAPHLHPPAKRYMRRSNHARRMRHSPALGYPFH